RAARRPHRRTRRTALEQAGAQARGAREVGRHERARSDAEELGRLAQRERTVKGIGFDTAVRPSSDRTTAARETFSPLLKSAGSRSARSGGSGSIAIGCHVPLRCTANVTLTGSFVSTRACTAQSVVLCGSAATDTMGFGGAITSIGCFASRTVAISGSTRSRRLPGPL